MVIYFECRLRHTIRMNKYNDYVLPQDGLRHHHSLTHSLFQVENIIMAGNQIERFTPEILAKMKYVKKVDLRMNLLSLTPSETMKFTTMEHLTHLDIRDNRITDLDIRGLKSLEYLNCERNNMISLQINGSSLKNLFAANNG